MLFQAVIKYLSSSNFFKILSKRLKIHYSDDSDNYGNEVGGHDGDNIMVMVKVVVTILVLKVKIAVHFDRIVAKRSALKYSMCRDESNIIVTEI